MADVSIVQRGWPKKKTDDSTEAPEGTKLRATPNPNVLFELGYAVKSMGDNRVVLLFNLAYGELPELPFDINRKRLLAYSFDSVQEKAESKAKLAKELQAAIEASIAAYRESLEGAKAGRLDLLTQQLNAASPAAAASAHDLWRSILEQAKEIWSPLDFHAQELSYEKFEQLLPRLDSAVADFSQAAYRCASHKNLEAVSELYRGFADWALLCDLPNNYNGTVHSNNHDLFKFIGHEMFLVLIASLVRYEFWDGLKAILAEDWGRRNRVRVHYSAIFSQYSHLFENEERKRNTRKLLVSELLAQRHGESGRFSASCSLKDLQAADLFILWHHVAGRNEQTPAYEAWYPWSLQAAQEVPGFLGRASARLYAERLMSLFGLSSIDELKQSLVESVRIIRSMFPGFAGHGPTMTHQIDPRQLGVR